MNEIIKTIFKMVVTGVLSVILIEIIFMLLILAQVIKLDMWQHTPFLQMIFSITNVGNMLEVDFKSGFETPTAIIFGCIPLLVYWLRKRKYDKKSII